MGTEAKRDHPVSYAGWGLGGPGLKPESLWSTNLCSGNTPARCSEVPCDGFTAPQTVAYKVCYQGWDVNPAGLAPESRLVTSQGAARSPPPPPPASLPAPSSQLPAPSSQLDEWPQSQHRALSLRTEFLLCCRQKWAPGGLGALPGTTFPLSSPENCLLLLRVPLPMSPYPMTLTPDPVTPYSPTHTWSCWLHLLGFHQPWFSLYIYPFTPCPKSH